MMLPEVRDQDGESGDENRDAVVVGGGFYGAAIALYLVNECGLRSVEVIERESGLMRRASLNNQARVHNGYHYPRDFTTAYRSRINLPRFLQDWSEAVVQDFTKIYAIARSNSKVTPQAFERFCEKIGAPVRAAGQTHSRLFEERMVDGLFEVDEYGFDATLLASKAEAGLRSSGVGVQCDTTVTSLSSGSRGAVIVETERRDGRRERILARHVFNCCYSGINQFGGDFAGTVTDVKHEIAEMALVKVPASLSNIGITVMDGPFFSLMPFPSRGLHTLSHVRFTPHLSWTDEPFADPYDRLDHYDKRSRFDRMMRDASRFVPAIAESTYVDSLFEVKSVLVKSEASDSRPILVERDANLPNVISVLGGKIDNIYDVIEQLEVFDLQPIPSRKASIHS